MKIFNALLTTVLFLCLNQPTYAQEPLPKTLLWKISGRGLQEPSFLFGTMHLSDKRLFQLDDSVYHAIETTQGFAIEVNPDELAAYYVNEMLGELENGKRLENILDSDDYRKYKKALGKKFRKAPEDITVNDIVKEKNKWVNEFMANGEMPTFLDAYLFNIARKQGKWTGGIEDLADQAGLMEDLVDISDVEYLLAENDNGTIAKSQLESMVGIYRDSDLNAIERSISGDSGIERDLLLIRRNVKMARRMDSLSSIRTMFFAVGAAHLPGDSGVIDLLQKRGFSVEPVISKNKMDASQYKYKEITIPWIEIADEQNLYTAAMPGEPVDFKSMGLINMKFQMDLFNLTGYSTMAAPVTLDYSNPDALFDKMAKKMFKGKKISKPLVIDSDGIIGREYIQQVDNVVTRMRIFLYKNIFYMAAAFNMKKEKTVSADIKRFFDSFVINRKINDDSQTQTHPFIDSIIGISFQSPVQLEFNDKMSNVASEDWKITTYSGVDLKNGGYIFLMAKDVLPGNYILDDSLILNEMHTYMESQYGTLEKKKINIQGYPTLLFEGDSLTNENVAMKMITTVRGNRNILLMVVGPDGYFQKPGNMQVFESFRFINFAQRPWKHYSDSTNSFTTWLPAPTVWEPYNYTGYRRGIVYSHDSIASISYTVTIDTLNKYYSVKNDSIYWKKSMDDMVLEGDSLISSKVVKNDLLTGREMIIRKNNSNTYVRGRTFLYGNLHFTLIAASQQKDLYEDNAQKTFNDFQIHLKADTFDIYSSKSQALLEDLLSNDSIVRQEAFEALTVIDFNEEDSALLKTALLKSYEVDPDAYNPYKINDAIAEKLVAVKASGLIDFVKTNYNNPASDSVNLESSLLYLLSLLRTSSAVETIGELMNIHKPDQALGYSTYSNFYDSLDLTLTFLDKTRSLRSDSIHGPLQAMMYSNLADSSSISKATLLEAEKDFIKLAHHDLQQNDSLNTGWYSSWNIIKILGKYSGTDAVKALNDYLNKGSNYLRKHAALQLVKMNQKVDPAVIMNLAADTEIRTDLYDELKEINKESLFPKKYLNQKSLSESEVFNLYDDVSITSASYAGTKTGKINGETYRFYLWKVKAEGEDDNTYLAVIGGYALSSKNLSILDYYSGLYSSETLEEASVEKLFNSYLEEINSEEE